MITFIISGDPRGKGRPRARMIKTRDGKSFISMYTDADTKKYEDLISQHAGVAMTGKAPLNIPLSVELEISVPIPASWSQKKQSQAARGEILPTTKPDIDNIVKAILDGMNGIVYEDDKFIVQVSSKKQYSVTPCVRVTVNNAMPFMGVI